MSASQERDADGSEADAASRKPLEPKDTFKFVLDTRNFEITNFWQRSNYFLVLNSGIAFGFFNLKETTYAPFLAVLGLVVSLLWYRVTLGSKFWQVHWEEKLAELEKRYAGAGLMDTELQLFRQSTSEVRAEVQESLMRETHGWLARLIDREIAKKPSVTLSMITLAVLFSVVWAALFLINVVPRMW